ncbi:MAG: Uma2 family endonuclease [Pseudonocardiales bacterium]|nr:Uma2 family endonuclease [Pseudonocardiales bacterium]
MVDPDLVALVVEVTSPSNAWVDRLIKSGAYAGAGIPSFLRVDLDRIGTELGATSYSLTTKGFVACTQTAGGRLTLLTEPLPVDLNLTLHVQRAQRGYEGAFTPLSPLNAGKR